MVHIKRLRIYPVKSCRGIEVAQSTVLATGLENDRRWMLVDPHGEFLTQRECPAMARLVPSLLNEQLLLAFANEQGLVAENTPILEVPILNAGIANTLAVQVWGFKGLALDCGHEASNFLSQALQRPVRLVQFSEREHRACSAKWTRGKSASTQFSDGYPVLVLGEASVQDLYQRLHHGNSPSAAQLDLFIERFRPNVLLSGLPAYEEDLVLHFCEQDVPRLELVKPCPRCAIPSLHPNSGAPSLVDPTAELAVYRYHQLAEGAVLGMNAIPLIAENEAGYRLKVGQVLETVYDFA